MTGAYLQRLYIWVGLMLIGSMSYTLKAQYIEARIQTDTTELRIGETVDLTLTVAYDPGLEIQMPYFVDTLGGMEILMADDPIEQQDNGRTMLQQHITLIAFDSGAYRIPSLDVLYTMANDTVLKSVFTNAIDLNVFTVQIDTAADIKPIKDIVTLPITIGEIAAWSGLVLVIVAIITGTIWFIRNRRKDEDEIPVPKYQVPPYEIAMRHLAQLEEKRLWQKGEIKAYYIELTDIIRTYIEEEFHVHALESVSHEIISDLRKKELPDRLLGQLNRLLDTADLAKFAKFQPKSDENLQTMEQGRNFLKESRRWREAQLKAEKEKATEKLPVESEEAETAPQQD